MANYISYLRSSYFLVKDRKAFDAFCDEYALRVWEGDEAYDGHKLVAFYEEDGAGLPCSIENPETGEYEDVDFLAELAKHLCEGWVCVVQEIGYEKMRYLVGISWAVAWDGSVKHITLEDIMDWASEKGQCTLPQY